VAGQPQPEIAPVGTWTNRATSYRTIDGKKVPQFTADFQIRARASRSSTTRTWQLGQNMNGIAQQQLGRLEVLPVAADRLLRALRSSPATSTNYRNQVEQGLNSRLEPQLARDENATRARLANSGLTQGSAAWNQEMDRLGRQANDARTQVMLASGGEARAAGGYQNQTRQQYIGEKMQERNQPLNEITALMSGGQVQQPGSPNWAGYGVAAPDLAGNIYQSYNQQQAQNNATMGGLFGLGGTIAGGLFGF
jgi:hypothetical protein